MAAHTSVAQLLGVDPVSDFALAEIVENGLPIEHIQSLREAGLTFTEVSDLVIAPRTLKHRKSRGEALSPDEADRALRVARTITQAESIFGERERALLWLRTPNDRLGERTPLSLLRTESGGRLVEEMLWQIDEGVYS
jgi:putative toxin-antitoxin system antitoxin component (TIGR02293 family)